MYKVHPNSEHEKRGLNGEPGERADWATSDDATRIIIH